MDGIGTDTWELNSSVFDVEGAWLFVKYFPKYHVRARGPVFVLELTLGDHPLHLGILDVKQTRRDRESIGLCKYC